MESATSIECGIYCRARPGPPRPAPPRPAPGERYVPRRASLKRRSSLRSSLRSITGARACAQPEARPEAQPGHIQNIRRQFFFYNGSAGAI